MKRVGVFGLLIVLPLVISYGCGEEPAGADETGVLVEFADCLPFEAYIWINEEPQPGPFSSEEPFFIALSAGSYTIYAESNLKVMETPPDPNYYFCWDSNFSVSDGEMTLLRLNCSGVRCIDTLTVTTE